MTVLYSTALIQRLFGEQGVDTGANGLKGLMKYGVIRIYAGSQPTSADAAVGGATLLGSITVNGGAFTEGSTANGLQLLAPAGRTISKSADVWKYTGLAAGTMGWFRFQANATDDDALDTSAWTRVRIDGSVGITSGDLRMTSVTSAVGSTATIDTFVITAA